MSSLVLFHPVVLETVLEVDLMHYFIFYHNSNQKPPSTSHYNVYCTSAPSLKSHLPRHIHLKPSEQPPESQDSNQNRASSPDHHAPYE